MSLRIRRGNDNQRTGINFDLGEPIWTIDTRKLYIGDGVTNGGRSLIKEYAGAGLTYNSEDDVLEVSLSSLTTDDITEGNNNLYFTNTKARDTVGSMLENGTNSGISFAYDDVTHTISATVSNNESVRDAIRDMLVGGTHYGILYNDRDSENLFDLSLDADTVSNIIGDTFTGTYTNGLSFTYDSETHTMDASLELSIQDDPAPMLGGNLVLNGNSITGTGDIDIVGDAQIQGTLTLESATGLICPISVDLAELKIGNPTALGGLKIAQFHNYFGSHRRTVSLSSATLSAGEVIQTSRGTIEEPDPILAGDRLMADSVEGWDGTQYVVSAGIAMFADPNAAVSTNAVPGLIAFATFPTSNLSTGHYIQLDSQGYFGVGYSVGDELKANVDINGIMRLSVQSQLPVGAVEGSIAIADGNTTGWDPKGTNLGLSYPCYFDGTTWNPMA